MKTLVRYNPRTLDAFERFDRMFDSMLGTGTRTATTRPVVDIREDEDRYVLEADLPGMSEEQVDVKLDENLLTISSVEEKQEEQKHEGYILKERRSRSFNRSFVLPRDVDREHIDARFENGVLTLELHKSPESKPRQIEINRTK